MNVDLRQNSVAAVILEARQTPSRRLLRVPRRSLVEESLAAVVLRTSSSRRLSLGAALFALAVVLHAGAGLALLTLQSGDRIRVEPSALKPSLQVDRIVDLEPPEPPEPHPTPKAALPPLAKARVVEPAPAVVQRPPASLRDAPPPPSEAGRVLAADESASQLLDFTQFAVATGEGQRYPGGISAPQGMSSSATQTPGVDRGADPNAVSGLAGARPVGAPRRDWDCPWPGQADALSIDEQFVVIRAVVRADGKVARAELISDPGYGFGAVALACARQQRFSAATDDNGVPIVATSPPIRVRFKRR